MIQNPVYFVEAIQQYDFPTLMQNIGLGLLALFIPIAIFILDFEKKTRGATDDDKRNELEFNKLVILTEVFLPKIFIVSVWLIFLTPFLNIFPWFNKYFLFYLTLIAFFAGFIGVCTVIKNSYLWLKWTDGINVSFRDLCRKRYVQKYKNWNDKKIVWDLVWKQKQSSGMEIDFFRTFIIDIKHLVDIREYDIAASYLMIFIEFMPNRDFKNWHLFKTVFSDISDLNFQFFSNRWTSSAGLNFSYWLGGATRQIIDKLFLSSLKLWTSFTSFKFLEEHTKNKNNAYLEDFFDIFSQTLFNNLYDSPEKHDILYHYFPWAWKVTEENLEQNIISKILLGQFLNWSVPRFWWTKKYDQELDSVLYLLFPDLDIIVWSELLLYAFNPWWDDRRMESLIETKKTFWMTSHTISTIDPQKVEEIFEWQRREAYKMATRLFKKEFTREKIVKYLNELRSMEGIYWPESRDEKRREYFIYLFESFLAYLDTE